MVREEGVAEPSRPGDPDERHYHRPVQAGKPAVAAHVTNQPNILDPLVIEKIAELRSERLRHVVKLVVPMREALVLYCQQRWLPPVMVDDLASASSVASDDCSRNEERTRPRERPGLLQQVVTNLLDVERQRVGRAEVVTHRLRPFYRCPATASRWFSGRFSKG